MTTWSKEQIAHYTGAICETDTDLGAIFLVTAGPQKGMKLLFQKHGTGFSSRAMKALLVAQGKMDRKEPFQNFLARMALAAVRNAPPEQE